MATRSGQAYPPPERRLRLGIVGGGRGLVGRWHLSGARLSDRWDLAAACPSRDPDAARQAGAAWLVPGDRVYSDHAAMAAAEAARPDGIEAVAICTPNDTHRPIAETFMKHGIDIICDKPLTMSLQDCDALAEARRAAGVVFAMTYPYPYLPMARQAREMVAAGVIGEVRQVMAEYAQEHAMMPGAGDRWRFDPAVSGRAGTTGDIGTHTFQLVEFVTGQRVSQLRAEFHVCGAPKALEDTAFLTLRLENGAPGAIWVSQAATGCYNGLRIRVFGTHGSLEWDQEQPELLRHAPLGGPEVLLRRGTGGGILPEVAHMSLLPRGHPEGLSEAWANLYTEIAVAVAARRAGRAVQEGALILPLLEDGARGIRFVHAAADSHAAGGAWQTLS